MLRPKKNKNEKEAVEEVDDLEKIKKLRALEAQMKQMQSAEAEKLKESSGNEDIAALESSIQQELAKATAGEGILPEGVKEADINAELQALEAELAGDQAAIVQTTYEKLLELHPWLAQAQYGFMYSVPNKKKQKQDFHSWKEEWGQVLLDYAKVGVFHVIFPKRLLTEEPFNKFQDRNTAIKFISESLIEKKIAKWMTRKKEQLRVYWKSIEEWVVVIESWAQDNAIIDLIMLPDIRESDQDFANLPDEDLRTIFKRLEKEQKADMVELSKSEFGIKFKFAG